MSELLKWALKYAALDWPVFPCNPLTKRPLTTNGFYDATLDEEQIHEWWEVKWPDSQIAVAIPDDICVVDIDNQEAMGVLRSLPPSVWSRTPRKGGGRHIVYKLPEGVKFKRKLEFIYGIDLLSKGGYFIVPPSKHPSGGIYEWGLSPFDRNPVLCPDWVIKKALEEEEPTMALDRLGDGIMSGKVDPSKILDGVPEGARNNALWRLACWARYHDLPLKVCIMMLDEAAVNCNPPYTEAKTEDIASRAYARYPSGSTNGMQKSSRTSWTLTDLVQSDIDEPVWLIEKILPHGFCLFYAHPKTGKSIIMESLAVTLAKGQKAFGQLSTLKTDVLYLELELGESMAKKRWTKILGNRGLADGENVQIELEWPRHDQGGLLNLRNYLDQHPRTKVVVVDTLGAFWPTEALVKGTAYNTDYALGQSIASVAHDYQCAIVCVYHKTKTEHGDSLKNISSSMGLSAAADVLWDLKRDRESGDATIEISGKMVEPMTLDLIQRGSAFNFEMMELHGEEE